MKTKRLILRNLNTADARPIARLAGDIDVARMTTRIPHPYTEYDAQIWIRGIDPQEFVQGVDYLGELVGLVGYTVTSKKTAELGYWIGKPWWGQGFATEAADCIIKLCFSTTRISCITCSHFIDNPASGRVVDKLGFRCIGINKAYCHARNQEVDTLIYEKRKPFAAHFWRQPA